MKDEVVTALNAMLQETQETSRRSETWKLFYEHEAGNVLRPVINKKKERNILPAIIFSAALKQNGNKPTTNLRHVEQNMLSFRLYKHKKTMSLSL